MEATPLVLIFASVVLMIVFFALYVGTASLAKRDYPQILFAIFVILYAWIVAYPKIFPLAYTGPYIGMPILVSAAYVLVSIFLLYMYENKYMWLSTKTPQMMLMAYLITIGCCIAYYVLYSRFAFTYHTAERSEKMCVKQPLEKETARWNLRAYSMMSSNGYIVFASLGVLLITLAGLITTSAIYYEGYEQYIVPTIALVIVFGLLLSNILKNALRTTQAPATYLYAIQDIAKFLYTAHAQNIDQQVKFEPLKTSILRNIQQYHNLIHPSDAERMYHDILSIPDNVEIVGYLRLAKDQYDFLLLSNLANDVIIGSKEQAPMDNDTNSAEYDASRAITATLKQALNDFGTLTFKVDETEADSSNSSIYDPSLGFVSVQRSVIKFMIVAIVVLSFFLFHILYKDLKMKVVIPIAIITAFGLITWQYMMDLST